MNAVTSIIPRQVRSLADKMAIAAGSKNPSDVYVLACLELALRIIRVASNCTSHEAIVKLQEIVDRLETKN